MQLPNFSAQGKQRKSGEVRKQHEEGRYKDADALQIDTIANDVVNDGIDCFHDTLMTRIIHIILSLGSHAKRENICGMSSSITDTSSSSPLV